MASTLQRLRAWHAPWGRNGRPSLGQWRGVSSTLPRYEALAAARQEVDSSTSGVESSASPQHLLRGHEQAEERIPFADLKGAVSYNTLKAITVKPMKLTHMTAVQEAVLGMLPGLADPYIPGIVGSEAPEAARDLMVKAKTGTGKTLAFLVPAIEARIKAVEAAGKQAVIDSGLTTDRNLEGRTRRAFARSNVGALILSPTRELATQIANEATRLVQHHEDFEVRLLTGGVSKRMQLREWMKGRLDIVVATTGRLRDVMQSEPEVVKALQHTQILILDEADTMLDMGFREDIDAIAEHLPKSTDRQTFLFSATINRAVEQVARRLMSKRQVYLNTVSVDDSPVHAHVPQFNTVVPSAADQLPHVLRLLAHDQLTNPGKSKSIVFLPTTKMTQLYATFLRELSRSVLPAGKETKVYEIHSKRTMESRSSTSSAFRNDKSGACVLVTSDVSARGVDYPGVSRVIQVGCPGSTEQYVHRVGRTGRTGGIVGRGDIVLLPWEVGFLTRQLMDVPMKPLTVDALKEQVATLAAKFDADDSSFFANDVQWVSYRDKTGRKVGPIRFKGPATPKLEAMPDEVKELLSTVEEEAINETMASLLGYYVGKSSELNIRKDVILEGCRDWSVQACGLERPPHISESFLQKVGFGSGVRSGKQGWDRPRRDRPSWAGRGSSRSRDVEDSEGGSSGFKSERFGKSSWNSERRSPRAFTESRSSGEPGEDRPSRGFGGGRFSRGFDGDRPSRGSDGDHPSRGFDGDRPSRGFGGDRPSRGFSGDRSSRNFGGADRPSRGYSGGFGESRPSGSFGEGRSSGGFGGRRRESHSSVESSDA